MSDQPLELSVKLVYDANAAQAEEAVKKSLSGIKDVAEDAGGKASKGLSGGFSAAKVAMGNLYAQAAIMAGKFAHDAITAPMDAFKEGDEQVRVLTSSFMLLSDAGMEFGEVKDIASGVHDELEGIAMQAGTTDDSIKAVFQDLIEGGTRSIETAEKLAESIAYAGRAVPGGAETIANSFRMIEMGMVKAKNPLVQMIASTHMLKGNAKQVAAEMSKMSVDEQMELAEKAITAMGKKMKEQPMTVDQMVTSLKVMAGNMMEAAGGPMVESAGKILAKIRGYFFDEEGNTTQLVATLQNAMTKFGEAIGSAFEIGETFAENFIGGFSNFQNDFKAMWDYIFGGGSEMKENLMAVATALGFVFGTEMKIVVTGLSAVVAGFKWVAKSMAELIGNLLVQLGELLDNDSIKLLGNKANQFALGAEQKDLLGDVRSRKAVPREAAQKFFQNAQAMGVDPAEARAQFAEAMDDRRKIENAIRGAGLAKQTEDAAEFAKQFQILAKMNDEESTKYAVNFIASNEKMARAVAIEGLGIFGESSKAFVSALQSTGQEAFAKELTDQGKAKLLGAGTKVTQNFSGAITMKQDFRDQDPDRIAVIFRRDLARAGEAPLSGKTTSPGAGAFTF